MRVFLGFLVVALAACGFSSNASTLDATGGGSDGGVVDAPDAAPDAILISFAPDVGVPEGTPATLAVNLSRAAATDITATLAVTGGTATPDDYTFPATTVTVPAGATTASVTLTPIDDGITEPAETVVLTLTNPTGGAAVGAKPTMTVTINPSDSPTVRFDDDTSAALETAHTGITVTINRTSPAEMTLDYTVTGTATQGADYTLAASGTLTWPANGARTQTLNLGEIADGLDENDETVVITLSNPKNLILDAAHAVHTHTIQDVDAPPSVSIDTATPSVGEGIGTATLVVSLSAKSGLDVTVPFAATAASTATAPADYAYTVTGGTLTIPAGQLSANLGVAVVNDTVDEDDETVVTKLGAPTNATLAAGADTVTLTIVDDDLACYGGTGTFELCVDRAPQTPVTINGVNTYDTSAGASGSICAATQPTWPNVVGTQGDVCLIAGSSIAINGPTTFFGARPVVLLSNSTLAINNNGSTTFGAIDARSTRGGGTSAPGVPAADCLNFARTPVGGATGGGGGAGGTFITAGGSGGNGSGGASLGGLASPVLAVPTTLHAGCSGQPGGGGDSLAGEQSGPRGFGGGAIYLVAKTSIGIGGSINASGAAGTHGDRHAGGSGGGSGGMIVIYSAAVSASGAATRIFADGGGAASGGSNGGSGNDGTDPIYQLQPPTGGTGPGGNGGAGFYGSTGAGNGGSSGANNGGGGGGGGGGYIKITPAINAAFTSAGKVDP